jgi:hypothetical protein
VNLRLGLSGLYQINQHDSKGILEVAGMSSGGGLSGSTATAPRCRRAWRQCPWPSWRRSLAAARARGQTTPPARATPAPGQRGLGRRRSVGGGTLHASFTGGGIVGAQPGSSLEAREVGSASVADGRGTRGRFDTGDLGGVAGGLGGFSSGDDEADFGRGGPSGRAALHSGGDVWGGALSTSHRRLGRRGPTRGLAGAVRGGVGMANTLGALGSRASPRVVQGGNKPIYGGVNSGRSQAAEAMGGSRLAWCSGLAGDFDPICGELDLGFRDGVDLDSGGWCLGHGHGRHRLHTAAGGGKGTFALVGGSSPMPPSDGGIQSVCGIRKGGCIRDGIPVYGGIGLGLGTPGGSGGGDGLDTGGLGASGGGNISTGDLISKPLGCLRRGHAAGASVAGGLSLMLLPVRHHLEDVDS